MSFLSSEFDVPYSAMPENLILLFLKNQRMDHSYADDINHIWIERQNLYYMKNADSTLDEILVKALGKGSELPMTSVKEERKRDDYERERKKTKKDDDMVLS